MKLIVGLGNPGRKYEQTRHNVGFDVLASLAGIVSASPPKTRFEGELSESVFGGDKLLLLCPHTFMNASGQSVRKAIDFFKLPIDDLLVICDDLDLDIGRIRFKRGGSAGGQKGLADIIGHLGSDSFARLKVGIDRPNAGWQTSDYVLGKFSPPQQKVIDDIVAQSASAALDWVSRGIGEAMNRHNNVGKPKKKPRRVKDTSEGSSGASTRSDKPSNDSQ